MPTAKITRPGKLYPRIIFLGLLSIHLLTANSLYAQSYDSLNKLVGHKAKVFYSNGAKESALQIATRTDKVINYYKDKLAVEPNVNILILSPADWPAYSAKGAIYGMPHYTSNQTLVVAAEDNPFWQSMVPPLDKLPKEIADQVKKTYKGKEGKLTMQPFFDLLAIHELGHAYHNQIGMKMQRRWMAELFPNILLHTYIAEKEPELLPALTLFPQVVIAGPTTGFTYTTLTQFEENYNDIARKSPQNYGWYQCRFHAAAAAIYEKAGNKAVSKLWNALKTQTEIIDDKALVELVTKQAHQAIADVLLKWSEK